MPKVAREMTPVEVRRLGAGVHAVGGVAGLVLEVKATGSRSWILRAMVGGKRTHIGLGGFPSVTLAGARDRARAMRLAIDEGRDPLAERRAAHEALRASNAKRVTFAEAARRCWAVRRDEFRSAKHRRDWISSLEVHAFPAIGALFVADVELPHVLSVLEPIWRDKTETATRVRQRIETVLDWSRVAGYREGENPARWRGNLDAVLPTAAKVRKVQHHLALPWREMPGFMAELRKRDGMGARALEFAVLTAARSGEVRGATWDEIDLVARTWTIPGERMKAGKEHVVPLPDAAVRLLEALPRMQGNPLVFPAVRGGKLSDVTLLAVVRRMGVEAVPHGLARATFKSWAQACSNMADEVSELALSHVNSDSTRAAYARDGLLPQRAALLQAWAGFLREGLPESAEVVTLRAAR